MLKFQTPPDKVFTIILQESMSLMIDQLRELEEYSEHAGTSPDKLKNLLPNAGRVFNWETALCVLRKMLICHKETCLYVLNDYHYLLLYDTLQNLCDIHNDMVRTSLNLKDKEETSRLGGVHIERINFDDLIAVYFHDIDFLLDAETVLRLGLDKREILGIHVETFGISQGLAPHPEELEIKPDDNDEYEMTEYPKFWSRSSKVYPDMKASDESSYCQ